MTIFRAPLANSKGEVMLSMQATGVVPAQATQFRGLWVTMNNLVCATNDTGQARKYVGGFALEASSGLLLVTETAPASVPMDGINANAAGAVVTKGGAGSLIHQGVGMTVSAPGGPIVVNQDEPALTFYAGLRYQSNSGSIIATQERNSEATFLDRDGLRKIAPPNQIRQEFQNGNPQGTLMEAPSTNLFMNSAAPVTQNIDLGLGEYTFSVEGSGSLTSANVGGTATGHGTATEGNPVTIDVTAAGTISFTVSGSLEYAQVEAGIFSSSFIITGATPKSRAIDLLSWSTTDPQGRNVINQTAGMIAILWRPHFSYADLTGTPTQRILSSGTAILYFARQAPNGQIVARCGTTTDERAPLPSPVVKGQYYLAVMRYAGVEFQAGNKASGTWTWSTGGVYSSINDSGKLIASEFGVGGIDSPVHVEGAYVWSEDKGTAWLESFFSGVAN